MFVRTLVSTRGLVVIVCNIFFGTFEELGVSNESGGACARDNNELKLKRNVLRDACY